MFTLRAAPNPLSQILNGLNEAAAPMLQQRATKNSQKAVFDTLSMIPEDASPLEATRLLYSNPNIKPEDRAAAAKMWQDSRNAQYREMSGKKSQPKPGSSAAEGIDRLTNGERNHYASTNAKRREYGISPLSLKQVFPYIFGDEEEEETDSTKPQGDIIQNALQEGNTQPKNPQQPATQEFEQHPVGMETTGAAKPEYSKQPYIPPYTGKALADWREKRRKENLPVYKETKSKLDTVEEEQRAIDILTDLNETGKLPQGMSRFLIDPKTGDLRDLAKISNWPNPETERYVKTVYNMLSGLKGTFGSRVTNFDVQSYMRRFPSLLNTQEGRRQIMKQITLVNSLNMAYSRALAQKLEEHGLHGIELERAQREAKDQVAPEIEKIETALKRIGKDEDSLERFDTLPNASQYEEGDILDDETTGEPAFILKNGKWAKA